MADRDAHTVATFSYAQLRLFDPKFPKIPNVYVCVETDLLVDVRREASEHFPDGGEIACYFPGEQRLKFVRHAGRSSFQNAGEVLPTEDGATIGMVVDALTSGSVSRWDWKWLQQRGPEFSTRDVEMRPLFK